MSPLKKLQLEQIREERREQIKQAAVKVFARRGFAGTKTSMIAAVAGISEGLIYRYFKSKDELFTTIVQELLEEAKREIEQLQFLPGSPYQQIKALTQNMLEEESKYAFMLIQRTRKEEAQEIAFQSLIQNFSNFLIDRLVPTFIKGQQTGEFCGGNPRQLLTWYFSVVNSLIVEEVGQEEYGLPDVDVLMRILTK